MIISFSWLMLLNLFPISPTVCHSKKLKSKKKILCTILAIILLNISMLTCSKIACRSQLKQKYEHITRKIIINGLSNILIQGITSLVCLFAMLYTSPSLTAFTVFIAVLQIVIMVILNKRNLLKTREYLYTQSMLQGELVDTLGNIIEIKCMGMDHPV